ncbi:probable glutamate receptor [Panulirus ornatus]|uniref:probable glutamate receptor n=1 Tax=Panulirus ornatus TaxID=150431 RepID=UPI003A8BCD79
MGMKEKMSGASSNTTGRHQPLSVHPHRLIVDVAGRSHSALFSFHASSASGQAQNMNPSYELTQRSGSRPRPPSFITPRMLLVQPNVKSNFHVPLTGNVETLAVAGEAIDAVMSTVSNPRCSVILLLDGNTSSTSVFTLGASWGATVLDVRVDDQMVRTTQTQLSQIVSEARRLRQLSWCVTVVVVSDDPAFLAAFAHWSLKGRLLVWSTRLLVLTRLPLQQLQNLKRTFSMTNSMLLIMEDSAESIRVNVYLYMPFSPEATPALQVASWTPHRGLTLTTNFFLFPEKFSKLYHGPTLLVAAEEFEPHIALMSEGGEVSPTPSFRGPMVNLLEILSSTLNFTYTYIRPPDGSWGVKLEDGSWTGMVGMVGRDEAHIALGPFGVSATRAEMVDYTRPILTETARILGSRGRPEVDPWGFLLPLTPLVWAAILTTLLVMPVIVFLLSATAGLNTRGNNLWPSKTFFGYIRVLLQQDSLVPPDLWWERLMLASWMMMTLVLTRSYTGNLMSYLAVRHISQPYQSLQDVVDDPSVSMLWETNTAYVQYFKSVKSGIFRKIADSEKEGRINYVRGSEFYKNLDASVRRGDHVIIAEYRYERVLMSRDFSNTGRCDFYTSKERFMPFMSGMVGPKDSPLVPVISEKIKFVTQTGLYDHWTEAYMPNSTSCSYPPTKIAVNTSLSVYNLWGMFVVLLCGHSVSLLLLGFEVLHMWNSSVHDVRIT